MKHTADKLIFDLHCDTLTTGEKEGKDLVNRGMHFSLDRLPQGARLCQCMAVFMPDEYRGKEAEAYFNRIVEYYHNQLEKYQDRVSPVTDTACVTQLLAEKDFALMLTVEGGSALAGKLENLYHLRDCGVKMMTLTWNGANELCGGAATNKGFTPFGCQVVSLMEELGIVVDVSHLSDKGFQELCGFAHRPFVASHSNSRAVCNHRRNLTDAMFAEIVDRGGLVGLNYFREFIVEDGETKTIDDLMRHALHFLALGGEDVLALGSDFDGADLPDYLAGLEKVDYLRDAFISAGISPDITEKIFFKNARRFFADYAAQTI